MNTLNLGSDEVPEGKKKSKNRNLKIALGLAAVILVPTIGSTLAGSITVSGGAVEFGQGFTTTASCEADNAITVTPSSILVGSTFNLESITVSAIDTAGCNGKYFTFKVLNGSDVLQTIGTGAGVTTNCKVHFIVATPSTSSNCTVSGSSSTGFAVAPTPTLTLAASNVSKITLESSSS